MLEALNFTIDGGAVLSGNSAVRITNYKEHPSPEALTTIFTHTHPLYSSLRCEVAPSTFFEEKPSFRTASPFITTPR